MTQIMIPAWVDGNLTPVEKLAVHERGLRHLAISVFIMRDDQILLQQRAMTKYHTPGLWANSCCTHPHWGEDPAPCAVRRIAEELGISGITLRHRGQLEYRAEVGNGLIEHEVVEVFLADVDDTLVIAPNAEEVMATRWVSLDQLRTDIAEQPDLFTPWLRIYMADHAATIFAV